MKIGFLSKKLIIILLSIFSTSIMYSKGTNVITYPAPEGETPSLDYNIKVNDKQVFVYQARVSAMPVNQVWPGYQRPQEQTEIASFAYFDFSGQVSIEMTSNKEIKSVDIRPKSYGINPVIKGNTIKFDLSRPCKIVVEVNGWHNALHLFANDIEKNPPKPGYTNLRYFGPGIHRAGIIKMNDKETIYIAGGAIVHGVIEATNLSNIKILGRGILDASTIGRFDANEMIAITNCSDILIDGIICRDPHKWTVTPRRCKNVKISDIKLVGLWRYNADGIDICNTEDVIIDNCFVRAFDDNIVIKGLRQRRSESNTKDMKVRNVEVRNCVLWNDWGRPLEIGVETNVDSVGYIVFKDCDIVHYVHIAMDIQLGDRAVVHHVKYENIRVEEPIVQNAKIADRPYDPSELGKLIEMVIRKTVISRDSIRGRIEDVSFKNITFNGSTSPRSVFEGFDDNHLIKNITFENITINGKNVKNLEQGNMILNIFTRNIMFK
jgi:hypothetical protein